MAEIDTTLNVLFKSANIVTETINTALNLLEAVLPKEDLNPENTAWRKAIDDGNIDVITCTNEDNRKILLSDLQDRDILYQCFGNMVFTFGSDRETVNEICQQFSEEKTVNEIISGNNQKGFIELNVESETDMNNFMDRLDKNNVDYTVIHSLKDGDSHKIIISDSDYDILNRIKIDVAIDKVDAEYNKIITKETQILDKYNLDLMKQIGLKDKESGFIIADVNGNVIQGNQKFMTINNENENPTRVLNSRINEYEKVMKAFCKMNQPTMLTKEQYELYQNSENKEDFLINVRREQGIGNLTKEELDTVMRHEKERELITQKLIQSHPEENIADLNDYNCEQSFLFFKKAEMENYEFNHDKSESGYQDAVFLDDAYMEYVGFDIVESETDYKGLSEIEERIFNEKERDKKLEELGIDIEEINVEENINTDTDLEEDTDVSNKETEDIELD